MKYRKPLLTGYSAVRAIQETGPAIKISDVKEPAPADAVRTDPAYQADE